MDEQRLKSFISSLGELISIRLQEIEALSKGDKGALAQLFSREAELAQDPTEKDALHFHSGELFIELNQKDRAVEQFGKIEKSAEWKCLSLLVLEENARFEGNLVRLSELYAERAKICGQDEARVLSLLRARLLAFNADDQKEAEKILDELVSRDPSNLPVLLTRAQLYLEEGDWKKLADAYKALFEMGEQSKEKLISAGYAYRIAALMEGRIGSPLAALEWYGKLFDTPEALYALPASTEILESLKQTKELKSALSKFAALVPDSERWLKALLYFKLSQLLESEGEKDAELDLLKKVADLAPENLLALFRLESVARENKEHQLLAGCLEKICNCLAEGELKFFYLIELAQLYLEFLEQPDKCEQALGKAQALQPDSLAVIRLRQSLAFHKQDWKAMVDALSAEIKLSEDPKELQTLLIKKAEALLYGSQDYKEAEQAYRQALEIAPSQFPLLRSLEQILARTGDFEGYLKILLVMEKLVTPASNRGYYAWRRTFISELGLSKPELAVAGLSDMIRLKPDSLVPLFQVARILRSKRAANNFITATERILAGAASLAEYPYLVYQAAWDFENLFNQPEKASDLWQKFSGLNIAFPVLLSEKRRLCYRNRDWARLEALWTGITEKITDTGIATSFRLRTGFLAETFLGEPGKARAGYERALHDGSAPLIYPALIELAGFQADWESASALLKDFGKQLSKPFHAAFAWQSVMTLWEKAEPTNERILEELKQAEEIADGWLEKGTRLEFLRRQSDYAALTSNLEEMISLMEESKLLPYQLEYAWLLSHRTEAKDQAIEQYLKLISTNDKYLPAIRELQLLALEMNHPRLMVQALSREIPCRNEPEVFTFIHHWLALVYEEDLKDNDRAIASLRALIKVRPDWLPALGELRRLYGKAKAYKDLVKTISAELGMLTDREPKIALLREQAQVYEQNLARPDSAVAALFAAHELAPEDREIVAELNRLYLSLEKWPELVAMLEKEISLETDPQKRAELQVQLGQFYYEKLGDLEKAVAKYEEAEKTLPDYMPLLRTLERLYTTADRSRELIRNLEKIASLVTDLNEKAEFINRAGKIYREKLNEAEPAIKSYLRALEIVPNNQTALENLVALFREKSDRPSQVKIQERLAEVLKGKPELALNLYLEAAEIYDQDLSDEASAINSYRKAAALAPSDLRPVRAERGIYERREDWKEVLRLLEAELKITPAAAEKKAVLARAGGICEHKLSDADRASGFYSAALKLDGEYLEAVRPLAEIYYNRQAWAPAEPLYGIWVKSLNQEKPERQAQVLYNFGMVLEQLKKTDKAMECYVGASQRKQRYLEPRSRLYNLYLERGKMPQAASVGQELIGALESAGDPKQLFTVLSRMGSLEKELGQTDPAIDYLERALAIEQNHYPSLRLLVDLYAGKKNWPKTLSSYDRLVRAAGSPELICSGLLEKGQVLEKELNQAESAIAHYRKAVQIKADSLMGWTCLANALKTEKKWNDAAEACQKMIALEPNPKNKIEHYYNLGLIYRDGFNDLPRAKESFEAALGLNKMHVPSMEAILSLYLKQKQWDKYIDLSSRFISLLPKEEEAKASSLHYQRAQVYRDFLEDRQKAVIEFQAVLKLCPDNLQPRIELAELYAKDSNSYPSAIREHQEIISRQLFRLESYHQMGSIYEMMGKLDEAFCCYKALEFFRAANRDENMFLDAHNAHVTPSSNKTLADDVIYRTLVHPDCRGAFLEILAEVGDYLADVLPPQLEKTGAGRSNKVPANSTAAIKKTADEIALNFGVGAYDLYLVPAQGEPKVAATEPPSLILNQEWMNHLSNEERRFVLGKHMTHLKLRHAIIFNNPLPEVLRAIMLFVWLVVPEVKVPGVSEGDLEKMAKPIKRAVPRKVRSSLEEKAKILAREGVPKETAKWLRGIQQTGNFAGMLLVNDLGEGLAAALKFDNKFKTVNLKELADPKTVLEQSEDARELLRFWTSEPYFALRKRSGFSLLSK